MARVYSTVILVLYCWIPGAIALLCLAGSALASWKARGVANLLLTGAVFVGVFTSLAMLYSIFYLGAAESLLPHFIVAATFAIFAGQGFYALKRNINLA